MMNSNIFRYTLSLYHLVYCYSTLPFLHSTCFMLVGNAERSRDRSIFHRKQKPPGEQTGGTALYSCVGQSLVKTGLWCHMQGCPLLNCSVLPRHLCETPLASHRSHPIFLFPRALLASGRGQPHAGCSSTLLHLTSLA